MTHSANVPEANVSDELLMAFADGELAGGEHARVLDYISQSPDGAARFAVFAKTGRSLADMFDQPMREPVPQRLIDTVVGFSRDNVVSLTDRRASRAGVSRVLFERPLWAAAAAACAAIAAFGIANRVPSKSIQGSDVAFGLSWTSDNTRVAGAELAAALDDTVSGSRVVRAISGQSATVTPVFSFASTKGGFCRQYVIEPSAGSETWAGVACRQASGQWRVEIHDTTATKRAADRQVVVAGKGNTAALDAVVDRLISGNVLGPEEEAAIIKDQWRLPTP
jgi:surface antigen